MKTEVLRKYLSQCHFVNHKSNMDGPVIKTVHPRWEAGDQSPEPWHGPGKVCDSSCYLICGRWVRNKDQSSSLFRAGTQRQGCTNPGRQVAHVTKCCNVAPINCASSVQNLRHCHTSGTRILMWLLDFFFCKFVYPCSKSNFTTLAAKR
jgi:hypothetical protein